MRRPIADLARRHWEKRWRPQVLDRCVTGRGLADILARDVDLVLRVLGALRVLEVGPGVYRFARAMLEAGASVSAVELPIPRAAGFRPPGVRCWHAWRAFPLPWGDGAFDCAYQRNALPNMPSRDIPPALDELARVARLMVWSGDVRPRFWEDGRLDGGARAARTMAMIEDRFEVEKLPGKLMVLRRRTIHGQDATAAQPPGGCRGRASVDSGHEGGASCGQALAPVRGAHPARLGPSPLFDPACAVGGSGGPA